MRGNRMMMVGGQSTYVPLRVNTAGMIPLIFAQSLLILPSTVASYFVYGQGRWLPGRPLLADVFIFELGYPADNQNIIPDKNMVRRNIRLYRIA